MERVGTPSPACYEWLDRGDSLRGNRLGDAIQGGAADTGTSGEFLAVGGGDGELGLESGDLFCRQFGLGAELDASGFGAGDALGSALPDEVALELANGGEHVEQQAAGRATSIDGLVEDDEVNLLGGDFSRDLTEVEDGAGEAIKSRNDELVTFADKRQGLAKRLALVAGSAALLLLEDPLAAVGLELVELGFEVLPDRRDAGVSNLHGLECVRGY